jgi:uncharacterized protein
MKCPNCNETLLITERQNVEIDYCPKCRGVWLDKGELDKIIERTSGYDGPNPNSNTKKNQPQDDNDDDDDNFQGGQGSQRGRRGGFFGNLFDFD